LCHVDLPSGSLIDQVTAHGDDDSSDGYYEALIWRQTGTFPFPDPISTTFAGTWQNSGVAATPSYGSFPIYLDSDAPHVVDGDYNYTIGFATKAPTGSVKIYGFTIDYTILP